MTVIVVGIVCEGDVFATVLLHATCTASLDAAKPFVPIGFDCYLPVWAVLRSTTVNVVVIVCVVVIRRLLRPLN